MTHKIFRLLLAISLFAVPILPVLAHSGAHPVRYVSNKGADDGVCNKVSAPCRTIAYAVNQSSKGDKIHVAEGEYQVKGLDVFFLLSDMVELKGGYSSDFTKHHPASSQSTIKGIPAEYRQRLAKRGFKLLQDTKDSDIQLSIEDKKLLETYKTISSKVEGPSPCENGMAANYECHNIDLQSHIPLNEFSTNPSSANDIWGFVDLNNQKEYALMGLRNATVVVDVSDPQVPVEVGSISGAASTWRDIKVYQYFDNSTSRYKAYAYVTTEANLQGIQILDLTDLPNQVTLVATISEFSTAHNIYLANVNYANGTALPGLSPYIYVEGSNKSSGAFRVFNLTDPINPSLETTAPAGTGYVHDATSLVITDSRTSACSNAHNPCELFVDFNEQTVDIWDMTDLTAPLMLSSTGYSGANYTHSGWWSDDKMTIFIQDELDERNLGLNTTLRALDISDLSNPQIIGTYTGQTAAIDHNGFTLGNYYYMSNYRRGLSVIDVSDPTNMKDVALFDTFSIPQENSANFNGAWGTYPYLPSGNILVSDIEYGLFVVKLNENDGDFPPPSSGGNSGDGNADGEITLNGGNASSGGGSLGIFGLVLVAFSGRSRFSIRKLSATEN